MVRHDRMIVPKCSSGRSLHRSAWMISQSSGLDLQLHLSCVDTFQMYSFRTELVCTCCASLQRADFHCCSPDGAMSQEKFFSSSQTRLRKKCRGEIFRTTMKRLIGSAFIRISRCVALLLISSTSATAACTNLEALWACRSDYSSLSPLAGVGMNRKSTWANRTHEQKNLWGQAHMYEPNITYEFSIHNFNLNG